MTSPLIDTMILGENSSPSRRQQPKSVQKRPLFARSRRRWGPSFPATTTTTTTTPTSSSSTPSSSAFLCVLLLVSSYCWNLVTAFRVVVTATTTPRRSHYAKSNFVSNNGESSMHAAATSSFSTSPMRTVLNQDARQQQQQRQQQQKNASSEHRPTTLFSSQRNRQRTMQLHATTAAPLADENSSSTNDNRRAPLRRVIKMLNPITWVLRLWLLIVTVFTSSPIQQVRAYATSALAPPRMTVATPSLKGLALPRVPAPIQYQPSQHNHHHHHHHHQQQHGNWLKNLFNRRQQAIDQVYQQRKDEWAAKYTSVEALRETFGRSANGVWGDLDAGTTRRLYKTLLPYALLELYNMGVHAEDLAELAYQARVAAKLYARERCLLHARVAANLYDGVRTWKKYGRFNTKGMTYQQVWNKYATAILEECRDAEDNEQSLTEEDVTARICLKILQRSCETNEMVDRMVLSDHSDEERTELRQITQKLEQDVRQLLRPPQADVKAINNKKQPSFKQPLQQDATFGKMDVRGGASEQAWGWKQPWKGIASANAAALASLSSLSSLSFSTAPLSSPSLSSPRRSTATPLTAERVKTLRSIARIKKRLESLQPVVNSRLMEH